MEATGSAQRLLSSYGGNISSTCDSWCIVVKQSPYVCHLVIGGGAGQDPTDVGGLRPGSCIFRGENVQRICKNPGRDGAGCRHTTVIRRDGGRARASHCTRTTAPDKPHRPPAALYGDCSSTAPGRSWRGQPPSAARETEASDRRHDRCPRLFRTLLDDCLTHRRGGRR